jgi:hypothetical protein
VPVAVIEEVGLDENGVPIEAIRPIAYARPMDVFTLRR